MSTEIYSVLKLQHYVVTRFEMKIDPTRELMVSDGVISLDYSVKTKPDSETDILMELLVEVNSDDTIFAEHGFRFACAVAGFFDAEQLESKNPDTWKSLFLNNGLSILYGIARTKIDEMASSTPIGRFVLPCVDFREFLKLEAESENSASDARE